MAEDRRPQERRVPAYCLSDVRQVASKGQYHLTGRVRRYIRRQGWTEGDVEACLCALVPGDFHKSQEHLDLPGVWLDIYRPRFRGERMYVKFVIECEAGANQVLSFCRDGQLH
jgi:hypothetical protein